MLQNAGVWQVSSTGGYSDVEMVLY